MSRTILLLRSLTYFRGVNIALAMGMVVATAVLTGAMMVGDSVRDSLADLARRRLGAVVHTPMEVDDALLARRFFDQSLGQRLAADPQLVGRYFVEPAIILSGGASNAEETIRAGSVQVIAGGGGMDAIPAGGAFLARPTAQALRLRRQGLPILLSLPDKPDEPRDAALSRRAREDTLVTLRVNVTRVRSVQDFYTLFNPLGSQRLPQNAWVKLGDLQGQLDLRGRVNTLLATDALAGDSPHSADLLNEAVRKLVRLEDYGLALEPAGQEGEAALTSRTIYLDPPLVAAADEISKADHIPVRKVTVNLINAVKLEPGGRQIHYAVAAGITRLGDKELADDEIAINQWTADQLRAHLGDRLHLVYYQRQPGGDLSEVSTDSLGYPLGFRIVRILPMSGLGADRSLTPQYKGLTDADSVADWNPPEGVEIDKRLVTKADEDYWHKYRAAPKLFLSFAAAQKLWGGPLGNITSLRVPQKQADEFRQKLHDRLDPAAMGLAFQPVMAQQMAASGGSTDFAGLFIGFSFFLIVAAVLLVAMLFRLSVEQRARQIGLLSAVGFTQWGLRRVMLAEGMLLASVGALLGLPAAVGYTWLMMYGLRTWWNDAMGTTSLFLYVRPQTLAYGFVASMIVAFCAILWAVWRVGRTPTATLLAGGWGGEQRTRRSGRWLRIGGLVLVGLSLAIFAYAAFDRASAEESFMGGGALLLFGVLLWLGGVLRPGLRRPDGPVGVATLSRLGARNATRHTARSVLATGLIAFAAFTLITVAAMKQGAPSDTGNVESGAGGFRLIVNAGIPLLGDLNARGGRQLLGMTDADDPLWNGVRFVSMRRHAGQDVSCLNLMQPTQPAILSVPPELIAAPDGNDTKHAHRFTFAQNGGERSNPWNLLGQPQPDGQIPVIADDNTAQYILHLGIGKTLDVTDAAGRPRRLRLVATLSNSIFQSELLMGQANFKQLFPEQDGFGAVLVDCPPDREAQVREALNSQLGEYAVDAQPTASRLLQYLTIQNTYLSTFQALGALGLMLGTIGLAVVLVRTVIERKAELALLASLGFRRTARVGLILSENLFLLVLGLAAGAVCAVLGIIPVLGQSDRGINYGALAATLLGVLLIGIVASTISVWVSGAHVTPADLRRE